MEDQTLESKIKLYCVLRGNNIKLMDRSPDKCVGCRAKNEGICYIRYNRSNKQILYDHETGKIIAISKGGYLDKEWLNGRHFRVNDKIYDGREVDSCWFCFGFLVSEK